MNCPYCTTSLSDSAAVCSSCARYVKGKECPACIERVPEKATRCRYCRHEFEADKPAHTFEAFSVEADALGTFLKKGRFLRQSVSVSTEKIVITTPGIFGLSQAEEDLPWQKIAGYNFHSGIFWDAIIIETRGQTSNVISPLSKEDGQKIREVLDKMKG